jgi:hypothetical protein
MALSHLFFVKKKIIAQSLDWAKIKLKPTLESFTL